MTAPPKWRMLKLPPHSPGSLVPSPEPPPTDGCGNVDFVGQCGGDGSLSYCDGGQLVVLECAALGCGCGYDDWNGFYDCLCDG